MEAVISAWGNSQGIRFHKTLLNELGLKVGDKVDISVREKEMIIKPKRKKYDLDELLAKVPNDYKPTEEILGSVGREVW